MENGRKIFSLNEVLKILSSKKKFLSKAFGVTDLAVFGSYAKNEQNDNSDIDIYVGMKNDFKTFDNFMDLKFFLEEILINKKVDLVTKESIREEFKTKVLMEAVNV
jgi:predicted nucleotidyltransferase